MIKNIKIDNELFELLSFNKFMVEKNFLETIKQSINYKPKGVSMKNVLMPEYIGYKGTEITLVWAGGSKTKAKPQSETEDVSFLYGFLIAYYKKVHEHLSREQIQAKLTRSIYGQNMDYQLGYLMSVFEENCGLSKRKIDQFLGQYVLIIMPFEIDLKDIAKTYTVDEKFLLKSSKFMKMPF